MRSNPARWCWWLRVFLLVLFLSLTSTGLAKDKSSKKGGGSDIGDIIRPELLNAQTDPTLRFPVVSMSGSITCGWLDITSTTIRYAAVRPTGKSGSSFEVSRFAIGDLRFNKNKVSFTAPQERQILIYLPEERWGRVYKWAHNGFEDSVSAAANRDSFGTASIYKTLLNFDAVLALVKPTSGSL